MVLQFAVAVNKRGLEEKESKEGGGIFGKMECIHAVAEAVQSVAEHTLVDLTNPEVMIYIPVLKCGYLERWALTSRIIFLTEMKPTSS